MERKINYLSICYTLFLILLLLSGSLEGIFSKVAYAAAFLLPIVLGLWLSKDSEVKEKSFLSISKADLKFTLPLITPTVVVIMVISLVTSAVIAVVMGAKNTVDVGDSFVFAIISHALIPSILEEVLFRYIPMKLLSDESKRVTVIASALFFALSHHSLFSIPYAFVAGVIFMAIDLKAKSIIPSFLVHFINNAISIGLLVYADNPGFAPSITIILGILLVISVVFLARNKQKYIFEAKKIFKNPDKILYTLPLMMFVIFSLFIAVISLM